MNKLRLLSAAGIATLSAICLLGCKTNTITNDNNTNDSSTSEGSSSKEVTTTKHSVNFYLNDTIYTTVSVEDGTSLSESDLPDVPTVEGYSVVWDTSSVSLNNISKDISIYAILTANEYTISYYLTDESGTTSLYQTQTYKYKDTIKAPSVSCPSGYTFSGWKNLGSTMTSSNLEIYGSLIAIDDSIDISSYSSGSVINISDGGTYKICGEGTNVSFNISASDEVNLVLDSVNDLSLTTPFITSDSILNISSTNTSLISTTTSFEGDGVIYSSKDITMSGDGYLEIVSSSTSAAGIMSSKSALNITSGTYKISSSYVGLWSKGKGASTTISGGSVNITSASDAIKSKTSVTVSGGDISLTSTTSDGINADSVEISQGTLDIISKNDGIQGDSLVSVSGGSIDITSNGGSSANATLKSGETSFVFEVEDTSSYTTEDEYYGLYVLYQSSYIELDEDNYSTYKSYTMYNKVSCKGLKSDTLVNISGGSITIDSLDDAIKSKANVTVSGGTTIITSASDGIVADTLLRVSSGSINIDTFATFYKSSSGKYSQSGSTYKKSENGSYDMYQSCKGLKSDTNIVLDGGTLTIDSDDDGVHSDTYVTINGGTINISTLDDGVHADTSLQVGSTSAQDSLITLNVNSSYEGLEAGTVYMDSGNVYIYSEDDGINAAGGSDSQDNEGPGDFNPGGGRGPFGKTSMSTTAQSTQTSEYNLYINGGYLTINAGGDGLDSNGNLYVTGGTTIIYGPTNGGNGSLDYGDSNNEFVYSGGTLIAVGTSGMTVFPTSGTYLYFSGISISKGTSITITSGSDTLFTLNGIKSANEVIFLSQNITKGSSYKLTAGSSTKTSTATSK